MKVILIPSTPEGWMQLFVVFGFIICLGIAIVVWRYVFPPAVQKLAADERYLQALAVYIEALRSDDPTRDERRTARAAATTYLINDCGIPSEEAATNMNLMVAAYDHDQSFELRDAGFVFEESGDFELALAYFERAARLQEEHDAKDYQFLQRCIARVRNKVQSR